MTKAVKDGLDTGYRRFLKCDPARSGPVSMKSHAAAPSEEVFRRALAAIQNGRPAEAERAAREILATNVHDRAALHLLGYALLTQRRACEALAPLEAATR